jgi:oligopeptide/dipeptide ABC transporter ATP-binding protein
MTSRDDLILEIKDLQTWFYTDNGVVRACDGVSYRVCRGETLAVVGESGSGKSVTAMSILDLIADPPGKIVAGEINFKGRDLLTISRAEMRRVRGNSIAMIFQEPMTSLNPVMRVGRQIGESLILHQGCTRQEARLQALDLMEMVGISDAATRLDAYPHQLSGGMRQRVMIAIALACRPELLIADEPTSALDVTIQAQILRLIKELQQKTDMAVILITHDMGVVAETADKVAVMYCGKIVEYGTSHEIFYHARHPYLQGLRRSVLDINEDLEELEIIEGTVPDPLDLPAGCSFEPRCPSRMARCRHEEPVLFRFSKEHYARCWLYAEECGDDS